MAGERDVFLLQRKLFAVSDPQHPLDQVNTRDLFGDGVFHLQAGVHLHEEELIGFVSRDDELDRAGTAVAHGTGRVAGRLADGRAGFFVQQRRRCFFDDLLVTALQRAFAFAQMNDVAVLISEDLHFNVPRGCHQALNEQGVVAEARRCLAAGCSKRVLEVLWVVHRVHALAAATG